MDSHNTEVVKQWPMPNFATDIRSFLGLAGYYIRFEEGFSSIAQSYDFEKSCAKLKTRLTTSPILTLPKGSDGYVIYYDTSRVVLGCVLM